MKGFIRRYFYTLLALYLATVLFKGLIFTGTFSLLFVSFGFVILEFIGTPFTRWFLRPFRFVILGAVGMGKWLEDVIYLAFLNLMVTGFQITSWQFQGVSNHGITIAAQNVSSILNLIFGALTILVVRSFGDWISKR